MRELGEGSFATVEEFVLRGQRVAVKRLRPELFADQEEIKCFLTEGVTLAKLDHRHVLPEGQEYALTLVFSIYSRK